MSTQCNLLHRNEGKTPDERRHRCERKSLKVLLDVESEKSGKRLLNTSHHSQNIVDDLPRNRQGIFLEWLRWINASTATINMTDGKVIKLPHGQEPLNPAELTCF